MSFRSSAALIVFAALAAGYAAAGLAQEYPSRAIRIVVPFTPGGGTDLLARLLSQRFYEGFGQTAVVENRAGSGGNIGAETVIRSPADGYTLLMSTASTAVNVSLYPKLPFDVRKDLIPITQVASAPIVLCVHPSVPARTIKELIALSKTRKEGLNFASNGTGTTSHLAGVMLQQMAGLAITHVPYKGASAAMTSLLGGEVDMGLPAVISGRPQIAAGRLRGLAVTTRRPSSVLPGIPTLDSMYPGFDIDNWFALFAPAGTPQAAVTRIHAEVVKSLQHPDFKGFMAREGAEPVGSTPAEFAAFFRTEIEKYAKIVKISGARPDS
jgi:tripartite-type tricarboxylate transporter receptor subunit TctC